MAASPYLELGLQVDKPPARQRHADAMRHHRATVRVCRRNWGRGGPARLHSLARLVHVAAGAAPEAASKGAAAVASTVSGACWQGSASNSRCALHPPLGTLIGYCTDAPFGLYWFASAPLMRDAAIAPPMPLMPANWLPPANCGKGAAQRVGGGAGWGGGVQACACSQSSWPAQLLDRTARLGS